MTHSFDAWCKSSPWLAILRGIEKDEVVEHTSCSDDAWLSFDEVPLNSPETVCQYSLIAKDLWSIRRFIGSGYRIWVTMAQLTELVATCAKLMCVRTRFPELIKRRKWLDLFAMPGFFTRAKRLRRLPRGRQMRVKITFRRRPYQRCM